MKAKKKMERKVTATEILKKPYARMVTPDEDGSYFAEIVEFPGCFATGRTSTEALENLESVAIDWINTTVGQGQNIPDPMEANSYSGKLVLRMPKSLHQRSALWAQREGVSLNQFIVTCIAEHVGSRARPMVVQSQTQGVPSITLLNIATVFPSMPSVIGTSQGAHQFVTSSGQQVVGLSMLNPWEQIRA